MKTISSILFLSLSVGLASAFDCFATGSTWPNREEARAFVDHACYAEGGMFTGWYSPRQMKSMCPHSVYNNLGLSFQVQNLNTNEGFDLGNDDCYKRLTDIIYQCSRGGKDTISGWFFRADPGEQC